MSSTPDRKRKAFFPFRALSRLALPGAALAALFLFFLLFRLGDRLLAKADAREERYRKKLGIKLHNRHDVLFYSSLDGPRPVNSISGRMVFLHNAPSVRGVLGDGRRFDDNRKSLLQTDASLALLPDSKGTLAFWFRPLSPETKTETRILWTTSGASLFGIRSCGGRLEVVCSATNGRATASAPFEPRKRFYHLAVTISPDELRLFIDGELKASAVPSGGLVLPRRPLAFGENPRVPLRADLDDVVLWGRPLSPAEIRRLARSRVPLPVRDEPFACARLQATQKGKSFLRSFFRVVDRLVPHRGGPALLQTGIPALELRLSKKDARHYRRAYEKTLLQGERTRRAADYRTISVSFGGHSEDVEACLDNLGYGEHAPPRYSFVIKAPPGFLGPGSGAVRLYPPERYRVYHPDAWRPLPLSRDHVVRLFLQGDFCGLYLMESLDRQGSAWLLSGDHDPRRTDFVLYHSQPSMAPGEKRMTEADVERRFREMSSLFRSDLHFPWSDQETGWRAREHASLREAKRYPSPALSEADLKGDNPAAFYVVTNLDLSVCGKDTRWTSSAPGVIEADGTVHRPSGSLPVVVELTGEFPDGARRKFRFRVVSATPGMASLHLHLSLPTEKKRSQDFTCLRFPAGNGPPEWLVGSAGTGSGAHHRGNTSYVRGAKRSMALSFDREADTGVTESPCRHLFILSGYADATRLRNKLSFDAFQWMRGGAGRRSSRVTWNEVFVNGEFAGVWEIASRLQDATGDVFQKMFKVRVPNGLWRTSEPEFLTYVGKTPLPEGVFRDFSELSEFVIGSDRETFLGRLDEFFDVEELADFWLLLNFTGNFDGRVTNQFLGRRRADGKWECLPWDYDKTFMDNGAKTARLSNPLYDRLQRESPEFMALVRKRWATHRAGPLSDRRVLGWIDRQSEYLGPYMDEEFRLLQPLDTTGDFKTQVRSLRSEVLFRLHQLDARLGL